MRPILESDGFSPFKLVLDFLEEVPEGKLKRISKKFFSGPSSKTNAPYLGGSISNYANDLIMTFPMLIDNSLSPDLCSMISKANERSIVTMLHLLFSSAQFKGNNGTEIIRSIYGKVKPNMSMDDYIDAVNGFVDNYSENYHPGYINRDKETNRLINETVKAIIQCTKEGKIYTPAFESSESINESSLLDYTVRKDRNDNTSVVKEAKSKYRGNAAQSLLDGSLKADDQGMFRVNPNSTLDTDDIRNANDYAYKSAQLANMRQRQQWEELDRKAREDQERRYGTTGSNVAYQQGMDIISRRILDSDVKKANELQPTLMVVNFVATERLDKGGHEEEQLINDKKSFVCGVKSRVIPVDATDIIERIVSKNKTRLSFLNFIRATTGEIGIVRDFVLSLDQAKIDAKNSIKKGEAAQIWKTLEALSTRNNLNKMRRNGNDASAITTLVVNKETVNLMKKQFKIDIEQPRAAKKLLEDYNLLGLFIVDESVEVVKILYRGNQMFDNQAFSYLEKEENDKSYKKVINLIGQMNR